MNQTQLTVVGNLTADPELRFTATGRAVAGLTVAVNPRQYDKTSNEWRDGEPGFHRVTVWGLLGENVAESLRKGDRVVVLGNLRQRHWEDTTGAKRSSWELVADAVGPDLTYAKATLAKIARTRAGEVPPDDPWANASKTRPEQATSGFPDDEPPF